MVRADPERSVRADSEIATHFDLRNAAERIYLTLSEDPFRYGARAGVALQ